MRFDELEVCLELIGELDVATAEQLFESVGAVCAARPGCDVQLELAAVSFVDAAGLGALVVAEKRVRAAGGRLRVTGMGPMARRLMEVVGLIDLLTGAGQATVITLAPAGDRLARSSRVAARDTAVEQA